MYLYSILCLCLNDDGLCALPAGFLARPILVSVTISATDNVYVLAHERRV